MSDRITLRSPRFHVVIGDPEIPATWEEYDVQAIGRDSVAAEALWGSKKLGKPLDTPVRFSTAMAYYALKRTGQYSGTFDDFEGDLIEANAVAQEEVFPTVPEPTPA